MKHLLATVCLLFFSVLGRAQTPMSGSSPVSTFDSISLKVRKELFSLSDSARAMKISSLKVEIIIEKGGKSKWLEALRLTATLQTCFCYCFTTLTE
jgi:hypothetical protein